MRMTRRGRATITTVVVLLVAVLVGWFVGRGGDPPLAPARPADSPSPSPSRAQAHLPLTGLPAGRGVPDRPAVIVKIDNTRPARPQVGLSAADLVVEEPAEGGATRLAVFFHSRLPKRVGPVRSLRTSDIGIVAPTGGLLVASGGAQRATRQVLAAGIPLAPFEGVGSSRDPARRRPYDLFVNPATVLAATPRLPRPADYFAWQRPGDPQPSPSGRRARRVNVRLSPSQTTRWRYAAGRGWLRTDDLAAASDRFVAANLVVIHVTTRDAGYRDPAGNRVPEAVTTGTGEALLLFGGTAVAAEWQKADAVSPFTFTAPDGTALAVPPGPTWVELVPEDGAAAVS